MTLITLPLLYSTLEYADQELEPLDEERTHRYKSAAGSMIYLTRSRFYLFYSVKALANGMSAPRQGALVATIRLAKHLSCAEHLVVKMTMSQEAVAKTGWKPGITREATEVFEAAQWPPIVAHCVAGLVFSARD